MKKYIFIISSIIFLLSSYNNSISQDQTKKKNQSVYKDIFIINTKADHPLIETIFVQDSIDINDWQMALLNSNYNVVDRLVGADAYLSTEQDGKFIKITLKAKLISIQTGKKRKKKMAKKHIYEV